MHDLAGFLRLDNHSDVAAALEDGASRTLRTGANAAERDTLIHESSGDVEVLGAKRLGGLSVSYRRGNYLVDRLTGRLRSELQGREGDSDVHAANQVHNATNLHRAHAHVAGDSVRAGSIAEQGEATAWSLVSFAHHQFLLRA